MSFDELISRQDLLAGLPAKRTNTLLFLIERQTARLAARSRVEFSLTDSAERDRELAFLEAFTLGKAPALRPTIQQLERFAPQWSVLVPDNPTLKASLINTLCQKYSFTKQLVPNIRAALNCEQLGVEQAYQRLYQKPIAVAFASQVPLKERLSWIAAASIQKVESLPPFWIASLVTIALGLPQAFLALPIAVAELGPLASVAFLIVLGMINILTMVCMAESIARSEDFVSGKTFIKQLATNYLGKAGSLILSVAVGIRVFLIALACYIGLSATMASFTSLPASLWAGLLFLFGLYILSRKSLNLTIGVTILLAGLNVSLLLFLTVLSFGHWQLANVLYVNWAFFRWECFQSPGIPSSLWCYLNALLRPCICGRMCKSSTTKRPKRHLLNLGKYHRYSFFDFPILPLGAGSQWSDRTTDTSNPNRNSFRTTGAAKWPNSENRRCNTRHFFVGNGMV